MIVSHLTDAELAAVLLPYVQAAGEIDAANEAARVCPLKDGRLAPGLSWMERLALMWLDEEALLDAMEPLQALQAGFTYDVGCLCDQLGLDMARVVLLQALGRRGG